MTNSPLWRIAFLTLSLAGSMTVVAAGPAAAASPSCGQYWQFRTVTRPDGTWGELFMPVDNQTNRNWRCAMSRGWSGDPVGLLQRSLNQCYWDDPGRRVIAARLAEDSSYGRLTRDAVTAVQRYHGIGADGVYGPQTAGTMFHHTHVFWPGGDVFGCWNVSQGGIG